MRKWFFDQSPNTAAITDKYVLEDGKPILSVIHYKDDDSWAFLSGLTCNTSDGRVISMQEALKIDHTIDKIAKMKSGHKAFRTGKYGNWKILDNEE
jgi:hypothetical protein